MIKKINVDNSSIRLGQLMRGNGWPETGQEIVFWNTTPSNFINERVHPVIVPQHWPEFAGNSVHFSSIIYDSLIGKWVMIFNECDTHQVQIYAAVSENLFDWKPANDGKAILRLADFDRCQWAGKDKTGRFPQTPFSSDIVRHNNQWYLFMDGYDAEGIRHIGLAISKEKVTGPYKIMSQPILSPGGKNSWNELSCFYPKVAKWGDRFVMFYDGRDRNGLEQVGMAFSSDLIHWKNVAHNPVIDQHTGWRSYEGTSEPNYIEIRNDSIFLLIAGVKKFKMGWWNHYLTKRMYLDKSGNVDDAQLGFYLSTDSGRNFVPHKNNPVLVNNYASVYENEHMGGNIELIRTDSLEFLFYQAKSSHQGLKYQVLLRTRPVSASNCVAKK